MRRIAIVGAGFAGMSAAWHLSASGRCAVTVFDSKGIGGGASGIAAGLLHPYPGEQGRRSFMASEAMRAAKHLLQVAQAKSALPLALENGILRFTLTEHFDDVEPQADGSFLIRSGMTVFCKRYLHALWLAAQELGAQLVQRHIETVEELSSFDHVILAAGAGIFSFSEAEGLRLERLKGQILTAKVPDGIIFPPQNLVGKGYIAHTEEDRIFHLGSTYERGAFDERADMEKAKEELLPKATILHSSAPSFEIIDCKAAFRVMRIGHYYPCLARLRDTIWVCTALGSRGLLYHGLLGELLREAILNDADVPKEFGIKLH